MAMHLYINLKNPGPELFDDKYNKYGIMRIRHYGSPTSEYARVVFAALNLIYSSREIRCTSTISCMDIEII